MRSVCWIAQVLGVIVWPALASAQTPSTQFGGEWPSLGECLIFSEQTGAWGWTRVATKLTSEDGKDQLSLGSPKIVFLEKGSFALGWDESEKTVNEFWRTKQKTESHMVKLVGRWRLEYRAPSAQERIAMGYDRTVSFQAWFLTLQFMGNELPAEYADYPGLQQAQVNGQLLFVLNEFQPFKKTPKSKPLTTTPAQLLWIVLSNELGNWLMPDTAATQRLLIMRHQ